MKKYLPKQSTLTNLLVMPLIASAIFLASPALASSTVNANKAQGTHIAKNRDGGHKGVAGTVTSINGSIITVTGVDKVTYTVDATDATIMKASDDKNTNPSIVNIDDVHAGDTIMVRGTIADDKTDITAKKVFDGNLALKKIRKAGIHKGRHMAKKAVTN